MKYTPHDYQKWVEEYIVSKPVAAVFLSMGLGKTVITLSAINRLLFDTFEVTKVLVIAPLRVARDTWKEELEKWDHLKDIRYSVAFGSEKERLDALKRNADIYITNREKVEWLIDKSGIPFDFDMVVLDELSSFKSSKAKRFKALMKVRPKVKRIVGLTGTPASNGLMDLFSEFRLLDMGKRLGRFITHYRDEFFTPDKRNGAVIFSYKLKPGSEERIYSKISDITISLKALDMVKMPKLINITKRVNIGPKALGYYKELKNDMVLEMKGERITALNAASLATKLMQVSNGFAYTENGTLEIHSEKLNVLEDLIESALGESLLIAYWFKKDKERIENLLQDLGVSYVLMDSSESIRRWKDKSVQIGLIHPASSGHGLNIQSGGSTLIWYSLPWSLELYEQTVARLWRQGQKEETVKVIALIATGTIEERIEKALSEKNKTESKLLDAVKAELEEVL